MINRMVNRMINRCFYNLFVKQNTKRNCSKFCLSIGQYLNDLRMAFLASELQPRNTLRERHAVTRCDSKKLWLWWLWWRTIKAKNGITLCRPRVGVKPPDLSWGKSHPSHFGLLLFSNSCSSKLPSFNFDLTQKTDIIWQTAGRLVTFFWNLANKPDGFWDDLNTVLHGQQGASQAMCQPQIGSLQNHIYLSLLSLP